jgi:hypothetical protein
LYGARKRRGSTSKPWPRGGVASPGPSRPRRALDERSRHLVLMFEATLGNRLSELWRKRNTRTESARLPCSVTRHAPFFSSACHLGVDARFGPGLDLLCEPPVKSPASGPTCGGVFLWWTCATREPGTSSNPASCLLKQGGSANAPETRSRF